jgi:hypothetical protein
VTWLLTHAAIGRSAYAATSARVDRGGRRPGDEPQVLPAVVGTGFGTRTIETGQMVRVDGSKGTVTIID